jgi:hypothetical protein
MWKQKNLTVPENITSRCYLKKLAYSSLNGEVFIINWTGKLFEESLGSKNGKISLVERSSSMPIHGQL